MDESGGSEQTRHRNPWRVVGDQDIESHTAEERVRLHAVGRRDHQPPVLNKRLAIGVFFGSKQVLRIFLVPAQSHDLLF